MVYVGYIEVATEYTTLMAAKLGKKQDNLELVDLTDMDIQTEGVKLF